MTVGFELDCEFEGEAGVDVDVEVDVDVGEDKSVLTWEISQSR